VLILFDEVLNFLNRHRDMAEPFHPFIQNLTVAMTGTKRGAAIVSLPRSQVEMTPWDLEWQEKITKVVRRVAKDLIVNDEAEIGEVIRRRLFEDLGSERTRRGVAREFAEWCFARRDQLPREWTAVDTATQDKKAQEFLQDRFAACYPFHPATLSVFQRKWQALPQYQQTRGTLAMLAQWVSWAYRDGFKNARTEPLITLGAAPLQVPEFRSVILGQLGESRLGPAIETDIAGAQSHARALDLDTKGPLADIHRRVGTTILFESSGGQRDKIAHLPELRFALCEPDVDPASVDNAALALEKAAFFIRRVGHDGFQVRYQPTLKKVVSDRRASLDADAEVKPNVRSIVERQFRAGATLPIVLFPSDGTAVPDSPRLSLVLADPETEWDESGAVREQTAEWTTKRGNSDRLYPGALVWCFRRPGRELRDRVENWLAWQRVQQEIASGSLGADFDRTETDRIQGEVIAAKEEAEDEVWSAYRYVVLTDSREQDGLKVIDLGAGHSSSGETLCGRVVTALKSDGLLNEAVGASYLQRNWPPALVESGAWPLTSLRQSFLNGSLTRLPDPDTTLRRKIVEFVERGDFGLASGHDPDGTYQRVWHAEPIEADEVSFDADVFLVTKRTAAALKGEAIKPVGEDGKPELILTPEPAPKPVETPEPRPEPRPTPEVVRLRLTGTIPSELWNRFGTKALPKLRTGEGLTIAVDFSVSVRADAAAALEVELKQALEDLRMGDRVRVERG
jgi:hypothetical protein